MRLVFTYRPKDGKGINCYVEQDDNGSILSGSPCKMALFMATEQWTERLRVISREECKKGFTVEAITELLERIDGWYCAHGDCR